MSTPESTISSSGLSGQSGSWQDIDSGGLSSPLGSSGLIAIVGMAIGCRLPGGVSSSAELWTMLQQEQTGQCKVPSDRFNVDAFYHPRGMDRPGSMSTWGGYFLTDDVRRFDNEFFGISPLEATYMDPQQRKLLEVVFESFESAGISLASLSGSNTGCYVGNFTVDFQTIQTRDAEYLHRYSATGMGTTILANRISHVFNLQGPSLVIDTACSSSLYCLHVACTALENGECDAAIVAGANLIQSAEQHLGTMKAGVLSPTSECHTFSERADGYGRADGIGCLFIKRLSDAIRDNDPIRAVIRGTAVNSNGRTPGITLPSALGQEAVIRKAYAKAGIGFDDTTYVECHGTGTAVGDPIEVEGLSRVFNRSGKPPLLIGAVKPNLGHSEAASGISSIIKTTLALENGRIPATVGVETVSPNIQTREWNVDIVTRSRSWPLSTPYLVRRAGVNAFGYGGANAHAILEDATQHVPARYGESCHERLPDLHSRTVYLIPFSAASKESLEGRVNDLAKYLVHTKCDILDLAYTLAHRRSHLSQRGYLLASKDALQNSIKAEELQTLSEPATNLPSRLAFILTGQGAQWPQMCKELFEEFPLFSTCIAELDAVLKSLPHPPMWNLQDVILEPIATSMINDVTRSQPACTAIQIALIMLLASWDVVPSAVIGHSSGELAAAFAAGFLSSAQAIIAAYYRGYVVGKHSLDGAMAAVGLASQTTDAIIKEAGLGAKVRVACVNSSESVTISGDDFAVDAILNKLQEQRVFARKLKTGGRAYHSYHMLALGSEYQSLVDEAFENLKKQSKLSDDILWISSVTGEPQLSAPDARYWRSNLENPVLFADAVARLTLEGGFHFIEIGPHSALELPIKQIRTGLGTKSNGMPYTTAITRGKNGSECLLSLVGRLYLHGINVSFDKINGLDDLSKSVAHRSLYKVLTDLPPYRWDYKEILWSESRASHESRHRRYARHELLGSQIPGGNGLEIRWRNLLRVTDVTWLKDHKLEETIVFPAAGYIAMALEAVAQATLKHADDKLTFRICNMHILKVLPVSAESTVGIELFTTLQPNPITSTSRSKKWWEFSITSYNESGSTTHATGLVSIDFACQPIQRRGNPLSVLLESSASRIWYKKLKKEGLNFGPVFQSVSEFKIPRTRDVQVCTARAPPLRCLQEDNGLEPPYFIHPVTIDAMLQTSIVASTAGAIQNLKGKVPVRISNAVFQTLQGSSADSWYIDSDAKVIGFGTAEINAELYSPDGNVKAQLESVRLALYDMSSQTEAIEKRHPMLRVLWKPDVYGLGLIPGDRLSCFLDEFVAENPQKIGNEGLLKLGVVLQLLTHKNPGLRILELGTERSDIADALFHRLPSAPPAESFRSYTCGYVSETGVFLRACENHKDHQEAEVRHLPLNIDQTFDLVLLPFISNSDAYLDIRLGVIKDLLTPNGILLALSASTREFHPQRDGFVAIQSKLRFNSGQIVLAHPVRNNQPEDPSKDLQVVVVDRGIDELSQALTDQLSITMRRKVERFSFNEISRDTLSPGVVVFSLIELSQPFLSSISISEMEHLKFITDNAHKLVWVTSGNLLDGGKPEMGLASGLARALMLEQPSLEFFNFEIDDITFQPQNTAENIIAILRQPSPVDFEFIQRNGIVYISRFVPDSVLNDVFRKRQGFEITEMSLREAQTTQLSIRQAGQFDTIYFKQIDYPESIKPTYVQVNVKMVGLNAKDFYVLGGKVDTKDGTCTLEYCGVVEKVGSAVSSLKSGDRVVVMAPGFFKTSEIVPEWACQRLEAHENFAVMSTLSVAYSTAIYALHERGRLQVGESILIHSAAGGVGIAAIQIAQQAGAQIYATVSTEAKRDYLVNAFGLERKNIFNSRDASFLPAILQATNGHGVDVVLNSLVGDLLHASWKCCASFGRFVELGKRDLSDTGKLEMEQFLKSVTFSAFDLSDLYYHGNPAYQEKWACLLSKVIALYRAGKISKIEPLEIFDIADITKAMRSFSLGSRIGKIAISLENSTSKIQVQSHKYITCLSPIKTYIMVGCLGGLGRSISKWMMTRGARKFIFLGRSGVDKAPASNLIQDLESSGAICQVVRGDVCKRKDVDEVVRQVKGEIGGVIQAAMGLNEALFTTMSATYWHSATDPKVMGTWNLHNAIKGKDNSLEFFLMTSSISGSIGTATESNYCSANYFLDLFARFRCSLGLPATSIGLGMISEVGYLYENPEIESLLLRKGIQAINEDELLQIIDIALSSAADPKLQTSYDPLAYAHILTGLESFGLKALRKSGFEGTNPTLNDPRAAFLARALDTEGTPTLHGRDRSLPAEVVTALEARVPLLEAISEHISKRFSNLVLVPLERVDVMKPLANFGMDSMIAAEFRTWFFQTFTIDIPFLELLSKTVTIGSLSKTVLEEHEKRNNGGDSMKKWSSLP